MSPSLHRVCYQFCDHPDLAALAIAVAARGQSIFFLSDVPLTVFDVAVIPLAIMSDGFNTLFSHNFIRALKLIRCIRFVSEFS